jgi:hypothetical protein
MVNKLIPDDERLDLLIGMLDGLSGHLAALKRLVWAKPLSGPNATAFVDASLKLEQALDNLRFQIEAQNDAD